MSLPRLVVVVVLLAGCHLGGGPAVAISTSGRIAVQAAAVGGVGPARADLAVDLLDSGGRRGGIASLGAWTFEREPPERGLGIGASVGAGNTDTGTGLVVAAAPFLLFTPEEADACDRSFTMATISLGVRLRGRDLEVFLAPHLHRVFAGCWPGS